MNPVVALLERAPWLVRPWLVAELERATADGFGFRVNRRTTCACLPSGRKVRWDLRRYAETTAGRAESLLADGRPQAVAGTRDRLQRNAVALGDMARRLLGVTDRAEALRALKAFYRCIGIEVVIDGNTNYGEEMIVTRCFFSRHFSPRTCWLAEALDRGIAQGLCPALDLHFSQRLTAGASHCRACLSAGSAARESQS